MSTNASAHTETPTVEEIREARARHKSAFDRYWNVPGGCDADIKIMHRFEDDG